MRTDGDAHLRDGVGIGRADDRPLLLRRPLLVGLRQSAEGFVRLRVDRAVADEILLRELLRAFEDGRVGGAAELEAGGVALHDDPVDDLLVFRGAAAEDGETMGGDELVVLRGLVVFLGRDVDDEAGLVHCDFL